MLVALPPRMQPEQPETTPRKIIGKVVGNLDE